RGDDKAAAVVGGQLVVQERLEGLEHLVGLGLAGPQQLPERTGTEVECTEQKHLGPMGFHSNTGRCHRYRSFRPEFEAHRALLRSGPAKCVNGGSLREQARLRDQASRTGAASVSDRVTPSLAIDCMLRYRRCTRHSSS